MNAPLRRTPRHLTLSFYLTLLGLIPGRVGAAIWTAFGFASLGILWDRFCSCTIGNWGAVDRRFARTHMPFLLLGLVRLWRSR